MTRNCWFATRLWVFARRSLSASISSSGRLMRAASKLPRAGSQREGVVFSPSDKCDQALLAWTLFGAIRGLLEIHLRSATRTRVEATHKTCRTAPAGAPWLECPLVYSWASYR